MKTMRWLCAAILLSAVNVLAQEDETPAPVDVPANYQSQLNIVYTTVNGWEGKLDLYRPQSATAPVPLVINIHGGAWTHGVKESQRGFGSFFKHGWAVANIEYRMSGTAPAPAAIEDARCALLFLVQHAAEYGFDPQRIVLMGGSAGGHLALMAGLLGTDNRFDANCVKVTGWKVVAIVDKYGIVDLTPAMQLKKGSSTRAWLGEKANDDAFLRSISPKFYLSKSAPPMFIVHGDADPTVPYQQSVDLKKALDSLGVQNVMITVEGGVHGKFPKEKNSEISKAMWQFFDAVPALKK